MMTQLSGSRGARLVGSFGQCVIRVGPGDGAVEGLGLTTGASNVGTMPITGCPVGLFSTIGAHVGPEDGAVEGLGLTTGALNVGTMFAAGCPVGTRVGSVDGAMAGLGLTTGALKVGTMFDAGCPVGLFSTISDCGARVGEREGDGPGQHKSWQPGVTNGLVQILVHWTALMRPVQAYTQSWSLSSSQSTTHSLGSRGAKLTPSLHSSTGQHAC